MTTNSSPWHVGTPAPAVLVAPVVRSGVPSTRQECRLADGVTCYVVHTCVSPHRQRTPPGGFRISSRVVRAWMYWSLRQEQRVGGSVVTKGIRVSVSATWCNVIKRKRKASISTKPKTRGQRRRLKQARAQVINCLFVCQKRKMPQMLRVARLTLRSQR